MSRFLKKTVGKKKEDKFSFLLYHLKRILPGGFQHISEILKDLKPIKDFSTLTQSERKKNGRGSYKIFKIALQKFSGSDNPEVQRKFLDNRFQSIHQNSEDYKPLTEQPSWKSVKNFVQVLSTDDKIQYSSMTELRKLKMKTHFETLDLVIKTLAGSNTLKDLKALVEDRLEKLHKHYKRFSWTNVKNLLEHI